MVIAVPWKRRRGSPKRKWLDNIRNHLSERELPGDETQFRIIWKRLIRNIDPHKMGKEDSFCSRDNSACIPPTVSAL